MSCFSGGSLKEFIPFHSIDPAAMVMAVCAARLTFCFVASFEDILLTGLPC